MTYAYKTQREHLFTDEGQRMFLQIRDNAIRLLRQAGAFQADKAWFRVPGDSWTQIACLDRMVELGEIVCVWDKGPAQHRIYREPA